MSSHQFHLGKPALRVALLALGAIACASPMLAQANDGPPPPPPARQGAPMGEMQGHMLKHLTRELNLTPDQVSQVQAIQADEATKIQALQADTTDPNHDRRKQMKAIHEDQSARIRALLTPDQQTKFDAMQTAQRQHQQERRSGEQNGEQNGTQAPPPPAL